MPLAHASRTCFSRISSRTRKTSFLLPLEPRRPDFGSSWILPMRLAARAPHNLRTRWVIAGSFAWLLLGLGHLRAYAWLPYACASAAYRFEEKVGAICLDWAASGLPQWKLEHAIADVAACLAELVRRVSPRPQRELGACKL